MSFDFDRLWVDEAQVIDRHIDPDIGSGATPAAAGQEQQGK